MHSGPYPPRKRLYITLASLLVLLLVGAVFARPTYHWVKQWRALQLTQASVAALRANDLQTAIQKAQASFQLWPFDPRVARQMATVASIANPARALPFWGHTWSLTHDPADLREVINSALAGGNLPLAFGEFNHLRQLQPENPLTWFTEARVLLAQNQWPEALPILKKLLDSGHAPDAAHVLYAEAAQNSPDPQVRNLGLEHLRLLSARSDQLGLSSLRALANFRDQAYPDLESLAHQLQNHPLATRDDKLLGLRLLGSLPGADGESIVKAARDLFPEGDDSSLVQVGHWLISQNKNAEVLKLIDADAAMKRRDLFLIRLDAMAGLGQWPALQSVLTKPGIPIPEELRLLFDARIQSELGRGVRADLAWDRVRVSVANEPAKLRDVAAYALKLKLDDVARPALAQLTKDPDERRFAYEQLVLLERHAHHTGALHQVLADMAHVFPNDSIVRNDVLYTGFLLGEANPDQIAAARKLVTDFPSILSFRITLALGLLVEKQPAEALKVFEGLAINWSTVYHSWRAVFAGVLRANGHLADANELEKLITEADLLPEEKALLALPAPGGPLRI